MPRMNLGVEVMRSVPIGLQKRQREPRLGPSRGVGGQRAPIGASPTLKSADLRRLWQLRFCFRYATLHTGVLPR